MTRPYVLLMGMTGVVLAGCHAPELPPPPGANDAITVTVTPIQVRSIARTVSAVGSLNGFEEVLLASKVEGRIRSIKADVGDYVQPGQILLEIDPTDYRLAVAEAEQMLAAEVAKLGLEALPAAELDLERIPAVKRAAVAVKDAERKFRQKKDLLAKGAGSPDEFDIAETELRLAEATKAQVETEARATLAAARLRQASLATAKQRLLDCQLTVPAPTLPMPGGKANYAVATRLVAEGEMVRSMPVTNAFKLVISDRLKLKVAIPERYAPEVKIGLPVEVFVDAYANKSFPGTVGRVSPVVDATNRTFQVEIDVPNPGGVLKCGGFAKAELKTRVDAKVLTVPPSAIVTFAGVNKVFVLDQGKAKAVEVKLGVREKEWVEISGELSESAQILVSGLTQVVDGSAVRLRNTDTNTPVK